MVAGLGERGVEEDVPAGEHAGHVAVRDSPQQLHALLRRAAAWTWYVARGTCRADRHRAEHAAWQGMHCSFSTPHGARAAGVGWSGCSLKHLRLPTVAGYGCRLRLQATGTGHGYRPRLQATVAGHGCELRVQACSWWRSRISSSAARLGPSPPTMKCTYGKRRQTYGQQRTGITGITGIIARTGILRAVPCRALLCIALCAGGVGCKA